MSDNAALAAPSEVPCAWRSPAPNPALTRRPGPRHFADGGEARQVDIAARLGVAQPTVARVLKRLARDGLVVQRPYRGVFLTTEGEALANASRERHRTVEAFLLALGVPEDTARRDSEGIEHHVSPETLAIFAAFTRQQETPRR